MISFLNRAFQATYEKVSNGRFLGIVNTFHDAGEHARSEVIANKKSAGNVFAFEDGNRAKYLIVASRRGWVIVHEGLDMIASSRYARTEIWGTWPSFQSTLLAMIIHDMPTDYILAFLDGGPFSKRDEWISLQPTLQQLISESEAKFD